MKTCTKTWRVRENEGEEGKEGGKAAGCTDNALFI